MDKRVLNIHIDLNPAGMLILRAAGVPEDLRGAGRMTPILLECVRAAENAWPASLLAEWSQSLKSLAAALRSRVDQQTTDSVALMRFLDTGTGVAEDLQRWKSAPPTQPHEQKLDALIGRALVASAQRNQHVPNEFVSSLVTLKLAMQRKGKRSPDWDAMLAVDLLSPSELEKLLKQVGPSTRISPLLRTMIPVLRAGIEPPPLLNRFPEMAEEAARSCNEVVEGVARHRGAMRQEDKAERPSVAGETKVDATNTHVSARLAAADYASVPEKLGLHHRDRLMLGDLSRLTKRLMSALRTGQGQEKAFATLALCSVVTGTTDMYALAIPLVPTRDQIWIDLDSEAWCWDFSPYRRNVSEFDSPIESIFVPLPRAVHRILVEAQRARPSATCLKDLITEIGGDEDFDLHRFRVFLRATGDSAHPAYRGRFARSIQAAVLEVTGSDMQTAILSAHFSATAPAALFYFFPRYEVIYKSVEKLYALLGLGQHTQPKEPGCTIGLGARTIPTESEMRQRWTSLMDMCDRLRAKLLAETCPAMRCTVANEWMRHLCAAFIVLSGHRGTRLDRLTFSSLYAAKDLVVIDDKDDTTGRDRAQPRVIGQTTCMQAVLQAIIECHIEMRAGVDTSTPVEFTGTDPVFVRFHEADEKESDQILAPALVAEVIRHHFDGAPLNFGRSLWVTLLDEVQVDRWLIRALTGHTRDITRVQDSYFDIPVTVIARRLIGPMQLIIARWFGPRVPEHSVRAFGVRPDTLPPRPRQRPKGQGIPDPRALLDPPDAQILSLWSVAHQVRRRLCLGQLDLPSTALATLHLLFMDLLPTGELALQATCEGNHTLASGTICPVVRWEREHFVHPTCIPIRESTWLLLKQCPERFSRDQLLSQLHEYNSWNSLIGITPDTPLALWQLLCQTAQSFRRLELAPSLLTVSHPDIPAPCLNAMSLARLGGDQAPVAGLQRPPKCRSTSPKHAQDVAALKQVLGRYESQTERLGERQRRASEAIKAIKAIRLLPVEWSPGGSWLRDWILEELPRTRNDVDGRYLLSSLSTLLASLTVRMEWDSGDDPLDWGEDEWRDYIDLIDHGCRGKPAPKDSPVDQRARTALLALVKSLVRRGQPIPALVFQRLYGPGEQQPPRDSASASLLRTADQARALDLCRDWLQEDPATRLLLEIRAQLCEKVPLRSGEVSSLASQCITQAGGLVIVRKGFAAHKTDASIRLVPLEEEDHLRLSSQIAQVELHTGKQELLIRGDASKPAIARDLKATHYWSVSLKMATGDPKARPHSIRAAALQELVWPGWQDQARDMMRTGLQPMNAMTWTGRLQETYTRLAGATAVAGHADIRAALGNYLSGWSFAHALHTLAIVPPVQPAPALLHQLGISPDALRKARSRASRTESKNGDDPGLCGWGWIEQLRRHRLKNRTPVQTPGVHSEEDHTKASKQPAPAKSTASDEARLLYLALRSFGKGMELATTKLDLPWSVAMRLEPHVPDQVSVEAVVRRARSAPGPRGVQASTEMLLSAEGRGLLQWLLGMPAEQLDFAACALVRELPADALTSWDVFSWTQLSKHLPAGLCLTVRIGATFLDDADLAYATLPDSRFTLKPDPRLGRRPLVTLGPAEGENRVLSARLTSVVRVLILSIRALSSSTK